MLDQFNVEEARKAGYSDDEILSHLTQTRKFDIAGAEKSGYSKAEIISHLAGSAPQAQEQPKSAPHRGFLGKMYDASLGGIIDTGKEILTGPGGGMGFLDRTGTAISKRFTEDKQPNRIAAAAGAVFGAPVESIAEDIKQGNYGGAAGTAAGNLLMLGLPAILKAGKSATTITPAVRQAAVTALEESAAKQYGQVLNPTTRGLKSVASEQTVPGLIERRVTAGSLKGLRDKASTQVEAIGQQIGDYWQKLPDEAATPADDIIGKIRQEATEAHSTPGPDGKPVFKGPMAKQGFENSKALADTLEQLVEVDANGNRVLPVKTLREHKQYWDDIAAAGKRYQGQPLAEYSQVEAHGRAADAIRTQFAKEYPDLASLNKEFSFWKNTEKIAEETILRRTGQAKPLTQQLAAVGGAAAGSGGGVIGGIVGAKAAATLATIARSTAWRTFSATTKDRLAKSLAKGNKAESSFYINKLAEEAKKAQIGSQIEDGK
jgi:hypothetical protein